MIKRTLYFGSPAYLKTRNEQLVVERPDTAPVSIPVEDTGVLILDHPQITLTQRLLDRLLANNVAVVTCNEQHHPVGLLLPLDGHSLQSQKFGEQIAASLPLKKGLWQQTVKAKILNQATLLQLRGGDATFLINQAKVVQSGDKGNCEAKAAAYYWKRLFPPQEVPGFLRHREGDPPNNLLNYGYAILRALVARALVGSGLLPTLGIHHRNQYNAYCLADDIMEPYRPFVDALVCQQISSETAWWDLSPERKKAFLQLPVTDTLMDGNLSPLMVAVQRTAGSLAKCFSGESGKILFPRFPQTR